MEGIRSCGGSRNSPGSTLLRGWEGWGGDLELINSGCSRRATNQRVKWPLSLKIRAATPKMLLGNLAGLGALERAGLSFAAIGIRPRRAAPGALRGAATQRGARPCVCTHVGVCTRVWLRV